jgi:hypothetical protein
LTESYAGGGSMTENIDKAGGEGTGAFAQQAIEIYARIKHLLSRNPLSNVVFLMRRI